MKKLLVEDVRVGVSAGGMACGPMPGDVVCEVCLRDTEADTVKYHSLVEVDGIPNFLEAEISLYDTLIANDYDEETEDTPLDHVAYDFDYEGFFDCEEELALEDETKPLILRYLISMVRADWKDVEKLKAKSVGKCLGDFDIPMSDVEEEYRDEYDGGAAQDKEADNEEDLMEGVRASFVGATVDTSELEEDEELGYEASYTSYSHFRVGDREYKLTYNFDLDHEGKITHIGKPVCERVVGKDTVPCEEGEVSLKRIYEELSFAVKNWM